MSISIINMSIKEKTEAFNKFTVEDRLKFLNALSDSDRKEFISDIRQQAVKDFWFHEREEKSEKEKKSEKKNKFSCSVDVNIINSRWMRA